MSSRLLKSLSSLVNGHTDRQPKHGAGEPDAGPSTLTTPLFPLTGDDADAPGAPQVPPHVAVSQPAANAETAPSGTLMPLAARPMLHKAGRKSASSRALNAVVRATTQVALPTQVEAAAPPKVHRAGHRSGVPLTQTEKVRLQIMQVQLKLTGLGLYDGTIDGVMNADLVDGIRHFQTLKGMRDSGTLTTGTLTALGIRAID